MLKFKHNITNEQKEDLIASFKRRIKFKSYSHSLNLEKMLFLTPFQLQYNNKTIQQLEKAIERIDFSKTNRNKNILNLKEYFHIKSFMDYMIDQSVSIFNTLNTENLTAKNVNNNINFYHTDVLLSDSTVSELIEKEFSNIANYIIELWLNLINSIVNNETPLFTIDYKLIQEEQIIESNVFYFYTDKFVEQENFIIEHELFDFSKYAYYRKKKAAVINTLKTKKIKLQDYYNYVSSDAGIRSEIKALNTFEYYGINKSEIKMENPVFNISEDLADQINIHIFGEVDMETYLNIFNGLDNYKKCYLMEATKCFM